MSDAGAVALAEMLTANATLDTLDLSYNRDIMTAGVAALADALHHNASLRSLDLASTSGGDEGVAAMATALRRNATLTRLVLTSDEYFLGRPLSDAAIAALREAARPGCRVVHDELEGVIFGSDSDA